MESRRKYSKIDQILMGFDQALGAAFGREITAGRVCPAEGQAESHLNERERRHAAGLMRVDHAGEIAAQALYQGQGLTARSQGVRQSMARAAAEEIDHLAWCEKRLQALNSHTSYLAPVWYTGSFAIGAVAGAVGDKWSLGFVAETERQVVKHLDEHLQQLPRNDNESRAILRQMREDESHHATAALEAGAAELPDVIKGLMTLCSKVMTTTAYWV